MRAGAPASARVRLNGRRAQDSIAVRRGARQARAVRASDVGLSLWLALAPLAQLAREPATTPRRASGEGFSALLWRSEPSIDELTRSIGGMCVPRGAPQLEEQLEREGLEHLVFNAAGRDELHLERERASWREPWLEWRRTRDPALLRREPCLAQPATREKLRATLAQTIAARSGARGLGLSLGDEVGLTPGGAPHDVCQCEACEEAFARWSARSGHAWLVRDGRALRLAEISTDAALRALAEGDTGAIGPWLARRDFHQAQVLDLLGELAAQARQAAPLAPLGLLGIAGRTAFGGVAPQGVLHWADFVECYRVGVARELLFTLRNERQSAWITLFRDARGPHASAWAAWEHWLRGGDGAVVWSDKELRAEPELAQRLSLALARIDALDRQLPHFRPAPRGVALIESAHSLAASWLREAAVDGASWPNRFASWQERHGAYESARNRWLALLEDCGAQPGCLPSNRIDAAAARRFALLIADTWLVVSPAELDGLRAYLQAGGKLLLSGEFAWIDSAGERHASDVRRELEQRFPGRVLTPLRDESFYASVPFDAALVERSRARLLAAGVELAPWRVMARSRPWLEAWCEVEDGFLGALAPALRDSGSLDWPDELVLEVDAPWRVEWLHPSDAEEESTPLSSEPLARAPRRVRVRPPPGDAVVLRLSR